jgi:hypothetical protein
MANKNCLWQPNLLMGQEEIRNLYRGPSIDVSYQVSYHLAKRFQRKSCFRNWPIKNKNAQCWASNFSLIFVRQIIRNWKFGNNNQTYPILIDWLMFGRLTFPWHIFNTYSGRERNSLIYKYYIKPNFSSFWPRSFREEVFLEIDQSKTRIACGSHIC